MNEVVELITQVISNCGFPIAAFLLMFFQNKETVKTINDMRESIISLTNAVEELRAHVKED